MEEEKSTFKEKLGQAWTIRSYIVSPWKLLFKKKVFYGVVIFIFAYWILPPSVTQYADMVLAPIWKATRSVAAEIGLVGLVKNTASGVSASVDYIQGPDEVENSLGEDVFYAGKPKNGSWIAAKSGNLQFSSLGSGEDSLQMMAFRLVKGELPLGELELKSGSVSLMPFVNEHSNNWVRVDKKEMAKSWRKLLEKLPADLDDMDDLWCVSGVERDENQMVQGFFLVMVDEFRQEVRTQAFYLPRHADGKDKISSYLITLDELEGKLGLDLLSGLEDGLETKLESEKPEWAW